MTATVGPVNRARKLLGEPLAHFLLLGALLFVLDVWWSSGAIPRGDSAIVIGEARIRSLAENFRRTWQRPPSSPELEGLVEEYVRDEVLTREATRLGLGNDDVVIRRRLRQKLEIITEETSSSEQPSDEQLRHFLNSHAERFRGEAKIEFAQVFFDPGRRGEKLSADMAAALATLRDERRSASADLSRLGDSLFVLRSSYPLTGQRAIAASFGAEFARALATQPSGQWLGPLESGYGSHLVRITRVEPDTVPTLTEIRPLVEREWRSARRIETRDAHYRALRANYAIRIKWPSPQP